MSLPGQTGRDQLAEGGNESVSAFHLLPVPFMREVQTFPNGPLLFDRACDHSP